MLLGKTKRHIFHWMVPFVNWIPYNWAWRLRWVLYKLFLKKLGNGVMIYDGGYIDFGENVSIGDGTGINRGTVIYGKGGVTIGSHCSIANDVTIISFDHPKGTPQTGVDTLSSIIIGDEVWIGAKAVILKGVTVGSHSVIGSGAVVTKSFPENSIIVGSEARRVGDV